MKPAKKVLFSSEERRSLPEVIAFLRTVADRLEQDGAVTLTQGGRQVEVRPQGNIVLEVEYEVEIELKWKPGADSGSTA